MVLFGWRLLRTYRWSASQECLFSYLESVINCWEIVITLYSAEWLESPHNQILWFCNSFNLHPSESLMVLYGGGGFAISPVH